MKTVLVSGGSGGLGLAICAKLASLGFQPIVGFAHHPDRAAEIAAQTGGRAIRLDLADNAAIDAALEQLAATDLAGVVLAGSVQPRGIPVDQEESAAILNNLQVAVLGPHRLLSGVIRQSFRPRRAGIVAGVLSAAMGDGFTKPAMARMGGYVVGKYGLKGLLASLAADCPWLTVHTVSPSFIETAMLDFMPARMTQLLREQDQRGRFDLPEEVASAVLTPFGDRP